MTTPFPPPPPVTQYYSVRVLTMSLKTVKVNKNVSDVQVLINQQNVQIRIRNLLNLNVLTECDHIAFFRKCPKFKVQIKIQADRAKARQEKLQNNLVVRGITFSNMVQNKTEKVQSELTEKKSNFNKRETELELGSIVLKLEYKVKESFKALSERA